MLGYFSPLGQLTRTLPSSPSHQKGFPTINITLTILSVSSDRKVSKSIHVPLSQSVIFAIASQTILYFFSKPRVLAVFKISPISHCLLASQQRLNMLQNYQICSLEKMGFLVTMSLTKRVFFSFSICSFLLMSIFELQLTDKRDSNDLYDKFIWFVVGFCQPQKLSIIIQMPKVVDNYVFERKIGSGQYGDVFKGYNKNNGTDIAIKAIKRENIKGKFMELLENEIKVLKTCDNRNIIKLYDIKKTANNFYLIIQFCNEGDLMALLKKKKTLAEEEAIEFFVQMLNAFKTLTKHKIMHRDFKLANILLHDGQIKIADFGFSKLLANNEEFTETMLGSPLNMAPQVLGGRKYDTKADIWSLGTCFYELLFGTPPYKAGNMVDLINNIKNKPLRFPKEANNISSITEDAIRKMLVVDPNKRIDWDELFKHPITTYLEEQMKNDMEDTMKGSDDIELNMSKFYLKNNMVVDHPKEIVKKENINNYAYDVVNKKKQVKQFEGKMIKRDSYEKVQRQSMKSLETVDQTNHDKESQKEITNEETLREKQIKAFKKNGNRLLHHRNIYVLLASVAEETMNQNIKFSDIVGYLLIRKLLNLLEWLKQKMENKKYFPEMDYWQLFIYEKDYHDIRSYVQKQYDVFKVFYNSIHSKIKDRVKELDSQTEAVVKDPKSPLSEKVYQRMIREYIRCQYAYLKQKKFSFDADEKKILVHVGRIIDCLSLEEVFMFEKNGEIFNFRNYYAEPQRLPLDELRKEIGRKMTII